MHNTSPQKKKRKKWPWIVLAAAVIAVGALAWSARQTAGKLMEEETVQWAGYCNVLQLFGQFNAGDG